MSRDNTGKGPTGVVVITLNRPDKLNALTEDMGEAFERTVRQLSVDDSIRYPISGYGIDSFLTHFGLF